MTLKLWRSRIPRPYPMKADPRAHCLPRHESRGSADVAKSDVTSPVCRAAAYHGDEMLQAAFYGYCSISPIYSNSMHARPDLCSYLLDNPRACTSHRRPVSPVSGPSVSDNVSPGTSPTAGSGNPPDPRPPAHPHASDHPATEVASAPQGSECRSRGKAGPSREWSNAALGERIRCRIGQSAGSIGR